MATVTPPHGGTPVRCCARVVRNAEALADIFIAGNAIMLVPAGHEEGEEERAHASKEERCGANQKWK